MSAAPSSPTELLVQLVLEWRISFAIDQTAVEKIDDGVSIAVSKSDRFVCQCSPTKVTVSQLVFEVLWGVRAARKLIHATLGK